MTQGPLICFGVILCLLALVHHSKTLQGNQLQNFGPDLVLSSEVENLKFPSIVPDLHNSILLRRNVKHVIEVRASTLI